MLRTSSYSTTALPYGFIGQLFGSSTKTAFQRAGQISTLLDFADLGSAPPSSLIGFVRGIEQSPPVVTVFQLNDPQGGQGAIRYVAPYAPLFDVAV